MSMPISAGRLLDAAGGGIEKRESEVVEAGGEAAGVVELALEGEGGGEGLGVCDGAGREGGREGE